MQPSTAQATPALTFHPLWRLRHNTLALHFPASDREVTHGSHKTLRRTGRNDDAAALSLRLP